MSVQDVNHVEFETDGLAHRVTSDSSSTGSTGVLQDLLCAKNNESKNLSSEAAGSELTRKELSH